VTDVDGISEDRSGTVSVFNGPPPTVCSLESKSEEIKAVSGWMTELLKPASCRMSLECSFGRKRN
jgi:hypothetical protein